MVEVEVEIEKPPKVEKPQWNKGQGGWDTDERGFKYWRIK